MCQDWHPSIAASDQTTATAKCCRTIVLGGVTEGVDWPNCRKCSFLVFFPTCSHVNLKFVNKDYVHQKMVKIGWPQITLLASDHLKCAHSSAMGPFFIPKTRYLWLPNTMRPSCMSQNRIQGGQKMTFLAPSWLIFSWFSLWEMAGILYLTNHWIFSPHFSCTDVIYRIK